MDVVTTLLILAKVSAEQIYVAAFAYCTVQIYLVPPRHQHFSDFITDAK